jgi:hypothetical protein
LLGFLTEVLSDCLLVKLFLICFFGFCTCDIGSFSRFYKLLVHVLGKHTDKGKVAILFIKI